MTSMELPNSATTATALNTPVRRRKKPSRFSPEKFSTDIFKRYKDMAGCYAFQKAGDFLYVGKAMCIYQRARSHNKTFPDYDRFTAIDLSHKLEGMDYRNAHHYLSFAEALLICHLDPIKNKRRPDLSKLVFPGQKSLMVACREIYKLMPDFRNPNHEPVIKKIERELLSKMESHYAP